MSITKAFILGAGLGTRLRPLTNVLPKPLVPVWNEPLVYHSLRHCTKAGIKSFAINTHHLPQTWNPYFPDQLFEGKPIEFFHEEMLLETGGGIKNIASFIGNEPILVFNGDIITDIDLPSLINAHTQSDNIATLAVKSSGPSINVAVEGDQIIDIRNDLNIHPGNHQFTGIYCISPEILELIPTDTKISIIPAFIELIKQSKLGAFSADQASWIDIGTIEHYKQAHNESPFKNEHGSFVHPSANVDKTCSVTDSIIWPNVTLAPNTKIHDSILCTPQTVSVHTSDEIL